ncbi:MAG: exosortase T [Deltaproteobacteria bacterium]|nr:exosortase T [Deltaproteobacteria bacterium]
MNRPASMSSAASRRTLLIAALAAPGLVLLAFEPACWLVRTWFDPAWGSWGGLAAAAWAWLALRSLRSGPAAAGPSRARLALGLLLLTAIVRLAGRLLAIRALGALALTVDCVALCLALGLDRRPYALAPWALAWLFAFSLPAEQILQRLLGFPLRLASAWAAQGLLVPCFGQVAREGTLLVSGGQSLAIDLPCSGAQGLMGLFALLAFAACRRRPGLGGMILAALLAAGGALAANSSRILFLFCGQRAGLPVFEEPFHSLAGLACLAAGALPLCALIRSWPERASEPVRRPCPARPLRLGTAPAAVTAAGFSLACTAPARRLWPARPLRLGTVPAAVMAAGFSLACIAIAAAPARPLDVSGAVLPLHLPANIGPLRGVPLPLSALERGYFLRYGGQAAKRGYGELRLVAVRSRAPLRHLHGPDRCLIGAGHRVQRIGVLPGVVPSVIWKSTGPDGRAWRVAASFVSQSGRSASSLSEVAWLWMTGPREAWTLVERIAPWELCANDPETCEHFDRAALAALD